jgi:hypothetical protein
LLPPSSTCRIGLGICRVTLAALLVPAGFLALTAHADDLSSPSPALLTSAAASDAALTGKTIYQRVLDNAYDSFIQTSSLFSGDRGGNEQWSRFRMWFQDERQDGVEPGKGEVVAKSRVQYTEPFEIRHAGYLVLSRNDQVNDQFVYMPSQRRVKRVNLRGEAVFGSDFSFEDILPREIEDAEYLRLADQRTFGRDCFVIEAIPDPLALSEYSRMIVHVDKERSLPLLTRYWNERGIEVKELKTDPDSVELIDEVWVAKQMTMRHLKFETYTRLELASIEANAKFNRPTFELRQLEARGR